MSATENRLVRYETHDGIAYIKLDRPDKLNAINARLILDLRDALNEFDHDDSVSVAIIHGAGRAFSSGADLVEAQKKDDGVSGMWSGALRPRDLFNGHVHWKPIVTAVHGYALGAGLGLAMRSDAVIATRSAKFQITEVPRNLPGGGLWALMQFRGAGAFADEVALTGRFFTGEEAARHGIVNQVTDDREHLLVAEEFAHKVKAMPQRSVRLIVRTRRWYMQETERQAGFLSEPRPLSEVPSPDDASGFFKRLLPPSDT